MGIRNAEVDAFLIISKPLAKFLANLEKGYIYPPQIITGRKPLHIK